MNEETISVDGRKFQLMGIAILKFGGAGSYTNCIMRLKKQEKQTQFAANVPIFLLLNLCLEREAMFKIGEECRYVNALDPQYENAIVVIEGLLEPRMICDAHFVGVVDCYLVRFKAYPDMPIRASEPFRLRKKWPREMDKIVSWSIVGWMPKGVNA